jgi:hypothetical protein
MPFKGRSDIRDTHAWAGAEFYRAIDLGKRETALKGDFLRRVFL